MCAGVDCAPRRVVMGEKDSNPQRAGPAKARREKVKVPTAWRRSWRPRCGHRWPPCGVAWRCGLDWTGLRVGTWQPCLRKPELQTPPPPTPEYTLTSSKGSCDTIVSGEKRAFLSFLPPRAWGLGWGNGWVYKGPQMTAVSVGVGQSRLLVPHKQCELLSFYLFF